MIFKWQAFEWQFKEIQAQKTCCIESEHMQKKIDKNFEHGRKLSEFLNVESAIKLQRERREEMSDNERERGVSESKWER